jgi:hypothetical protein
MFRSFADVKTAQMLDLPRPHLHGGKAITVACPMSDTQREMQDHLIQRYGAVRAGKVKPWEDNALAITTDGRKLALDARLLSAFAADVPDAKINALVENVADIWRSSAATRGTQLIFSDIGVKPTAWGFSVYQDVIGKLVRQGIPREEIACIGDADTDAKKQVLFNKVRAGTVRVVLGSTQKMGTGTNVQKRLLALHHLDAPWKPAEVEQRDGRIVRQGNTNEEVFIYRYVTEGSFDAYMWQALETKARFIGQVMTGDLSVRQADDIGGQDLTYAEVKAIASGNPAVLTLAEADAEVKRLTILKKHHTDEQYLARRAMRELPEQIARLENRVLDLTQDSMTAAAHADDPVMIGGRAYNREHLTEALAAHLKTLTTGIHEARHVPLGTYRGLAFGLALTPGYTPDVYVEGRARRRGTLSRGHHGPRAVLNAVERLVAGYEAERARVTRDVQVAQGQLRDYTARQDGVFAHEAYLQELTGLRQQLEAALSDTQEASDTGELVERIKALQAAHTVEAARNPAARVAAPPPPSR